MISNNLLKGFSMTLLFSSVFMFSTVNANAYSRNNIKKIIVEEAMNSIVPAELALAVAKVESDFNPAALSSAGARGVMQIMPRTARGEFGISDEELWNARLNIQLGIDYLAQLYRQYGGRWDLALSHYNGGTLRGHGSRAKPHRYTRNYVRSVNRWWRRYKDQSTVWMVASLDNKLTPTDAWEPARTKIKESLRKSINRYKRTAAASKRRLSTLRDRTYRRFLKTSGATDHDQKPDRRITKSTSAGYFNEEFLRRVERARQDLDDFGPPPRHGQG